MICLVYFKTDGWPWIHLNEAGSSGSEVVAGRYTVLSLRCRAWGFPWLLCTWLPAYRGSIVWNLLEPSAISTKDLMLKGQKSLMPSESWTLMKSHLKWVVPKLTVISSVIDSIHIFYCTYFTFYWPHSIFFSK